MTDVVRMAAGARSGHAFKPVGPLALDGLPEPLAACELTWTPPPDRAIPLPTRLSVRPPAGFVGRGHERSKLASTADVATRQRRVVLVSGEPGIGKTALASEVATTARDSGADVLYGRCDADVGRPYQPFVEALTHYVAHSPESVLDAHVAEHGGELVRLVPELRRRIAGVPPPQTDDADAERSMLFGSVVALLAAASRDAPLVLVLDDLHWADKPTLSLFRHLVTSDTPMALLVIGTYRDSDLSATHSLTSVLADLRRETNVDRLTLEGLAATELIELMESAAGHRLDQPGRELARALHRETDGNPFFAAEILRHLVESGMIVQTGGHWTSTLDLRQVGLPGSVREVVAQRVARLGDLAARALRVGAVVGRDFGLDVVSRVLSDVPEDALIEALEAAVEASLLVEVADSTEGFSFVHALIRRTLYDDLSGVRRRRLHHRVAEALEDVCGDDLGGRVGALAHQWAEARLDDPGRAISYAQQAGQAAMAQLAPDEALRWFTRALDLAGDGGVRGVGGVGARPNGDARRRCDLLIGLGEAQRQAGEPSHRETLLEAAEIAQKLGDRDRLVAAALANNRGFHSATGVVDVERVAVLRAALDAVAGCDGPAPALLLATQAVEATYSGDWQGRRLLADHALDAARRIGDKPTLTRVLTLRFPTLNVPDTVDERHAQAEEALQMADALGDPVLRGYATWFCLWSCAERGDLLEADRHLEQLQGLADRVGQSFLRYTVAFSGSWRALLAGRIEEAEVLAGEALQIGNDSGQPEAQPLYISQLCEIRRYQGQLDEVVELLAQVTADNPGIPGLRAHLAGTYCELDRDADAAAVLVPDLGDTFAAFPYDPLWLVGMALLASACAHLGMAQPAAVLYDRLAPFEDQLPFAGSAVYGSVAYYLGLLASTMGRYDDADTHFSAAAGRHDNIGAVYWLAVTRLDWARMLLARDRAGDAARAWALAEQARAVAGDLGFSAIQRRGAALLATH
jgi:tetratricopeptide (TPR) repeat protein